MLRLFFTNKMFLAYMLSSCLLIQGFASAFAVFPLYAEELGIAKYHVSFCYIILLDSYKIKLPKIKCYKLVTIVSLVAKID